MYGEEIKKSSEDLMTRQGCSYRGYTVFAGETVIKTADYNETGYKVYIGPKRYFVTSDVGDGRVQWYVFEKAKLILVLGLIITSPILISFYYTLHIL